MPYRVYLVGGAVRDALLGLKPRERDWVVVGGSPEDLLQQGYRQVGATLRAGDGVDLIDDHPAHRSEDLFDRGGQHEIQALGCGDEDVGRMRDHPAALALRGVAGAHRHRRDDDAGVWASVGDACEWRPQVAFDVVGEGLHRRHVQHFAALLV